MVCVNHRHIRELDPEKHRLVEDGLNARKGLRQIARESGLSKDTVLRYAKIIRGIAVPQKAVGRVQHDKEKRKAMESIVIPGVCACGCGKPTAQYTVYDAKNGKRVGQYRKWVQGHFQTALRLSAAKTGLSHFARRKQMDQLRAEMVAAFHKDRFVTRTDILERFADRGVDRANLSRIFINGLKDLSYKVNEDELAVPAPRPKPKQPVYEPYERKHIPHEAETDIKYLTRSLRFMSLDEDPFEDGSSRHDRIPSLSMDPAEAMMAEEERHEYEDLQVRRNQFREWREAKTPLTSMGELFDAIPK